jgi:hypothetical protein
VAESNEFWKEALQKANEERQQLVERRLMFDAMLSNLELDREENEQRIRQLEKAMGELANLAGNRFYAALLPIEGLTSRPLAQACREVLKSADRHWTAIDVRDTLVEQKYDMSAHNNPLATIHSILKRFAESGEVVMTGNGRRRTYRWKERDEMKFPAAVYYGQPAKCHFDATDAYQPKPDVSLLGGVGRFGKYSNRIKVQLREPGEKRVQDYLHRFGQSCAGNESLGSSYLSKTRELFSPLGITFENSDPDHVGNPDEDRKD